MGELYQQQAILPITSSITVAVFSQAIFQVTEQVMARNLMETGGRPTSLNSSKLANFSGILIKFKPPNQVA